MKDHEIIGLIASVLGILGSGYALYRTVIVPWLKRKGILPDDQIKARPVTKDRLSWRDVGAAVEELSSQAKLSRVDGVFGINRGGAILAGMLAKRLDIPLVRHLDVDSDRLVDTVKFHELGGSYSYSRILLVDDVVRTGQNMACASNFLKLKYNSDIITASILEIREDRHDPEDHLKSPGVIDKSVFYTFLTTVKLPWDRKTP